MYFNGSIIVFCLKSQEVYQEITLLTRGYDGKQRGKKEIPFLEVHKGSAALRQMACCFFV